MDQPPPLVDLIRDLSPKLRNQAAIQAQMVTVMRDIQAIVVFANRDLIDLDDELDNLYGGTL